MKKVLFILGPTAVGKSKVGIAIAKKYNGEIISADSVQVFKGLDIGSAKIGDMQGVVHYGIDILDADKSFSVFEFVEYTKKKIDEISAKGKLPIVVGGTGLYVKALTEGYNLGGVERDDALRSELEKLAKEKGVGALYEKLRVINPKMAEKTDKNNAVRLIRAIEISLGKGQKEQQKVEFDCLIIALNRPRDKIYADINLRVDDMLKQGLIAEVEGLRARGLSKENQSMHAIGYKEVLDYLDGVCDYDTMVSLIKQHSRNYAKRQLTFLKGIKNCHMLDIENGTKQVYQLIEEWL